MKKFLSLVLALVMTMSLVTISAGAKDFSDADAINYDEDVEVLTAIGVVDGYTDGAFKPGNALNRGQAAKIICNLILGPTTAADLSADTQLFPDVPVDHVFAGYISFCVEEGIISGYADGSFRPAAPLTSYAFMKMLLGALGYDAETEGYVGANWSINVAKRALNIGLAKGLDGDFNGIDTVTREEACLYAFNALKAKEVNYGDKSTIKVGDIEISTNAEVQEGDVFYTKYFKKLKDTAPNTDDFGRPATTWKYDGDKVGTYAKAADASYTTKVDSDTIYNDLGLANGITATVLKNGESDGTFALADNDEDTKIGDNGVLTEVFVTKNATTNEVASVKIVKIHTYIAQVDDIDTNEDDERVVVVDGMEYVTEEFAEDDYVLYTQETVGTDSIKSMVLVEKQTGELNKKVGSKYTIDGEVYGSSAEIEATTVKVGKDVDYFVDEYGYIIKIDPASTTVDVSNMALVLSADADRSAGWAKLAFSDGTAKEVDTVKNYGAGNSLDKNADGTGDTDAITLRTIVSYEVDEDGIYELTWAAEEAAANADDSKTVTKGNPMVGGVKTNNATQFVYIITDGTDVSYETYVGYKNIPSTDDNAADLTYYLNDNGVATLMFVQIDATDVNTTAADVTVIAYDADVSETDEGSNKKYYEYNAVVGGEVTTVKVAPGAWATIAAAGDFYAVEGLTYDSKGVGALGNPYALVSGGASTIKVDGESVIMDGTSYSYDEDTLAIVVDEGEIAVIDVEDIKELSATKTPYSSVDFQVDSDDAYVLDVVILVKA